MNTVKLKEWLLREIGAKALATNDLDLEELVAELEELGYIGEDGLPCDPQAAREVAEGVVRRAVLRQATFLIEGHYPCPTCGGSGKDPREAPCSTCEGLGHFPVRASLGEVLRALGLEV